MKLPSRHGLLFLGSLATLSLTACSGNEAETTANSIVIAASFYPIEEIVSDLSGGTIGVVGLTPPGVGAHDLELTSEQLAELEESDVLFYLGDGVPENGVWRSKHLLKPQPLPHRYWGLELRTSLYGG